MSICANLIYRLLGTNATSTDKGATCELWDDSKKNEFDRVEAARAEAAARVAKENPAVGAADLKALALAAPPAPPANIAHHIAIHAAGRPAPRVHVPRRRAAAVIAAPPPLYIPPAYPAIANHGLALQQQQEQLAAQAMADHYIATGQLALAARHQAIAERHAQAIIFIQQQQMQQNQALAIQQQQANLHQVQQQQAFAQQQVLIQQQQLHLNQQRMRQLEAQQQELQKRRLADQKIALVRQRAANRARAEQVEQVKAAKRKAEDDREAKRARLVKR